MRTIKVFVPADRVESLEKAAKKVKKNVPGFVMTIGQPYYRCFIHCDNIDGILHRRAEYHNIVDVHIEMPDDSGWQLIATYEDGNFFVTDPSKKIEFKNPEHGKDYGKCDFCGHKCYNSYVIYNESTGEELQVGCECVKKFGLSYMSWLSRLTRELYRGCDLSFISIGGDEEYPTWPWSKDKGSFRAIRVVELITACREYYKVQPKWIKGYYEDRTYIKSRSNIEIQQSICGIEISDEDERYAKDVCEFIQNIEVDWHSEFSQEMYAISTQYYAKPANACHVFFMVKKYEDHLKELNSSFKKIDNGTLLHVEGEVVAEDKEEGWYGSYVVYTIKTPKGYLVTRKGKIPITENDGHKTTSFYAFSEFYKTGEVTVGRALKNPKKGYEIITL
ncbi:MAG: hypothetical protein K2H01_04730 [Ruminococcus sp.]|nr:hypothetical protein [Ruminococcus sp.]